MSLSLDDIKNFKVVASTLNVTRASEVLGLSQPALSYSLKRLERELGFDVLIRLKNGVQLTKSGEEFLKKAGDLIQSWQEAQNIHSINEDLKKIRGEFSIGLHPSVALYTLDKLLPSLSKELPLVDISIIHGHSREIVKKVINWEVDFGIVINPVEHPDLVIKELGKDVVTLFKSAKANKKIICDPSLSQSLFVLKGIKKLGIDFSGQIHSTNLEVVSKLASVGVGYGLLPTRVASAYKNLKPVKGAPEFKDRICLVYRHEKHSNNVSRKVLELIRALKV